MSKKCEICGKYLKNMRGYNIHYNRMHGRRQETNVNIPQIDELLNRIRKLELDNTFIKIQLKHKTFTNKSKDADLDWDLTPEVKEVKDEMKIQFTVLIKELKIIFKREDDEIFNYHNVLKPINPVEEPMCPPIMVESLKLVI